MEQQINVDPFNGKINAEASTESGFEIYDPTAWGPPMLFESVIVYGLANEQQEVFEVENKPNGEAIYRLSDGLFGFMSRRLPDYIQLAPVPPDGFIEH